MEDVRRQNMYMKNSMWKFRAILAMFFVGFPVTVGCVKMEMEPGIATLLVFLLSTIAFIFIGRFLKE